MYWIRNILSQRDQMYKCRGDCIFKLKSHAKQNCLIAKQNCLILLIYLFIFFDKEQDVYYA